MLEAILMYMANTASFVRLAAFALSHAMLCLVIFSLTEALGAAASFVILLLGNAVIIALEGLIVGIQSMRLEYYEFFNKFFSGEGTAYRPFDLKSEEP